MIEYLVQSVRFVIWNVVFILLATLPFVFTSFVLLLVFYVSKWKK